MVQKLQIGGTRELEPTIFSAVITPHRSLGSIGFLVLMIVFGGVSFVTGIAFLLMGAWPVFGFFGLDVAAAVLGDSSSTTGTPRPTSKSP